MTVEREQGLSSELALLMGCCKDASTVTIHANERSLNTASESDEEESCNSSSEREEEGCEKNRAPFTILHCPVTFCEAASACKKEGLELANLNDANFLTATTIAFHEAGANTQS